MEGSVRRWRSGGSPERSKRRVEPPPPPKQLQQQPQRPQLQVQVPQLQRSPGSRIPVVYYLCRNSHLEHPHFIEVPISSPDGVYLRDVIGRLNALRGKRFAAGYSWSCKRNYKSGFVWQDLSDDDLILPVNENEYVLKGSVLLDASPSDRLHQSATSTSHRVQNSRHQLQIESPPLASRSQDSSPPSSTVVARESTPPARPPHSPVRSPLALPAPRGTLSPGLCKRHSYSGDASPESSKRCSSEGCEGSPRLVEYKIHRTSRATDASTQTEERTGGGGRERTEAKEASTRRLSAEEGQTDPESFDRLQTQGTKEITEITRDGVSPPPASTSTSSSCEKLNTLESLIRAEARKMNRFRFLDDDETLVPTGPKLKATNMLMQLITCGSISVKGSQSFGLVHKYNPRLLTGSAPPPVFNSSRMLGELDFLSQNPRLVGTKLEEEYFNGNFFETKKHGKLEKEVDMSLKSSSTSFDADRNCKSPASVLEKEQGAASSVTKCLSRVSKSTPSKQPKTMRSPVSDSHIFPHGSPSCYLANSPSSMNGANARSPGTSFLKGSPMKLESSAGDSDNIIKIEERLPSGARVIIQAVAPSIGITQES